jgi:hypothetical protein
VTKDGKILEMQEFVADNFPHLLENADAERTSGRIAYSNV